MNLKIGCFFYSRKFGQNNGVHISSLLPSSQLRSLSISWNGTVHLLQLASMQQWITQHQDRVFQQPLLLVLFIGGIRKCVIICFHIIIQTPQFPTRLSLLSPLPLNLLFLLLSDLFQNVMYLYLFVSFTYNCDITFLPCLSITDSFLSFCSGKQFTFWLYQHL